MHMGIWSSNETVQVLLFKFSSDKTKFENLRAYGGPVNRICASPSHHWSAVLAVFAYFLAVSADNTTCAGSQLDWYTQPVGETPVNFLCLSIPVLKVNSCVDRYDIPAAAAGVF
jgi:hypothetical protein